jgi:hypothetical protein
MVEFGAYANIDDELRVLMDSKVSEAESLAAARTELFDKAALALRTSEQASSAPYRAWAYGFAVYLSKIVSRELRHRGELSRETLLEIVELV